METYSIGQGNCRIDPRPATNAAYAGASPQVDAFSPQGEAKGVRQVAVRFTELMVAFGDPRLSDPFTVHCEGDAARLKGRGRWADARNWAVGFSRRYTVGVWVGNSSGEPMHDVSGVTGAAPVWRELMDYLHEGAAPARPAPPAGLVRGAVAYAEDLEPRREEWFLAGTESALVTPVAATAGRPRILAPSDGAILALDPDIPARRQRVAIRVSGAQAGARLQVDGAAAAPADAIGLWMPAPGRHRLRLVAADGSELDSVRVTVRGLR